MEEETILNDSIIAMEKSLDKRRFNWTNIFANRLVTDAVMKKNEFYNLFGIFMKDSIELISLFDRIEEIDSILIKEMQNFIVEFKKLAEKSPENKVEILWANYKQLYSKLLNIQSADEEKHYKENIQFTDESVEYLVTMCLNNLKESIIKKRFVIFGVMNELERIYKNYGFEIKHLVLKTYITLYNRTCDYIIYDVLEQKDEQTEETKEKLLQKITPFINNLTDYQEDPIEFIKNSEEFLLELAKEWRTLYLIYLNIVPRSVKVKKKEQDQVIVPDEAKEQLKNIVSKSIFDKGEN